MSKTASVGSSEISAGTLTSHGYKSVGTRDDLVRRALALIPMLRARAAEADALRRLPAETVRDLKDSGVARVLQPARYGG
jgi:alkylation response protein AidB-like acyl-CoA dehydrogenase